MIHESLCWKKKPTNTRKTYLPELSDPSLQNLPQASEPFDSSLDHRRRRNKVAHIFRLALPFPFFIVVLLTSLTAIYDISFLTPVTK